MDEPTASVSQDDIWQFSLSLSNRLMAINLLNVWIGRRLLKQQGFLQGIGSQAVGWGIINIGIAVFGRAATHRKLDSLSDPTDETAQAAEQRKLLRVLAVNAPLNLLYIWGGYQMARRNHAHAVRSGMGWGIMVQGLILLFFDSYHLMQVNAIRHHGSNAHSS